MSIIGKNLRNAKKHNRQILEHNRHRPTPYIHVKPSLTYLYISLGISSSMMHYCKHHAGTGSGVSYKTVVMRIW